MDKVIESILNGETPRQAFEGHYHYEDFKDLNIQKPILVSLISLSKEDLVKIKNNVEDIKEKIQSLDSSVSETLNLLKGVKSFRNFDDLQNRLDSVKNTCDYLLDDIDLALNGEDPDTVIDDPYDW